MRVSRPDSGASSAQCAHSGTQGPEQGAPGGQDPAAPSASLGTCSEEGTLPATGPEAPPLLKSVSGACQGAPPEAGGVRTAGGRACLPPPPESPRPSALARARRAGGTAKRSGRSEKRVGSLLRFQHGKRQLFQQRPGQGGPGRQAAVKHLVYRTWGEEGGPSPSRETSTAAPAVTATGVRASADTRRGRANAQDAVAVRSPVAARGSAASGVNSFPLDDERRTAGSEVGFRAAGGAELTGHPHGDSGGQAGPVCPVAGGIWPCPLPH